MNITINHSVAFKANEPKKFESLAQKVMRKLQEEGRVTVLSKEATAEIDNDMATSFEKIKKDYLRKSSASWNAVKDVIVSKFIK